MTTPKVAAILAAMLVGGLFLFNHNSSPAAPAQSGPAVEHTTISACYAGRDTLLLLRRGASNAEWAANRDDWQGVATIGGDLTSPQSVRATAIAADVQAVVLSTTDQQTPITALERAIRAVPGCDKYDWYASALAL